MSVEQDIAKQAYDRRLATLRRLGAKIVELRCGRCQTMFVDPKPLGGRAWKVVMMTASQYHGQRRDTRRFCSETCASDALAKTRGVSAWIEGYDPPDAPTGSK